MVYTIGTKFGGLVRLDRVNEKLLDVRLNLVVDDWMQLVQDPLLVFSYSVYPSTIDKGNWPAIIKE